MGFNIAGLTINKNYKNNINELEKILGETLHFEKEVIFEEASENWKENDYCDIYFSKEGTLIFLSMEVAGFEFEVLNQDSFSFVLSEMSMIFNINYCEDGELIRSIIESEGNIMQENGTPLHFEKQENDKSELIYHLFEKTLSESFHTIDIEAKCFRYRFKDDNIETNLESKN